MPDRKRVARKQESIGRICEMVGRKERGMRRIMLSQLLALIAVSFDTKKVTVSYGILNWAKTKREALNHGLTLLWKRGRCCGRESMRICMILDRFDSSEPIFRAYYFEGDNCNDRTRFIYKCLANETAIVDDIGIVGADERITRRTNLLKINPHDSETFNALQRWRTNDD